uniref:Uncharacterized protein n=1 Tax=Rhizophora mucronata TaxID=61149 RepID=A0A2P2N064_RHIMU
MISNNYYIKLSKEAYLLLFYTM